MNSSNFTFLNATGAPELSQLAAKQMRAHVTRTNFAKRRQRIAETGTSERKAKGAAARGKGQEPLTRSELTALALPLMIQPTDACRYAHFLSRFWSLLFLDGSDYPGNPDEASWIALVVSEPALIESSVAVSVRHWSPALGYQYMAEYHSSRANNIIIQRITSGRAHTDAVLGAVVNMAFGERLRHNDHAWNIHIDGLARLIKERRSQGATDLPQWFCDLLVLDSVNDVLQFPRIYHEKIIKAVSTYGDKGIFEVASICAKLVQLQRSIKTYRKGQVDSDFVSEEIEEPFHRLLYQARALRLVNNPPFQATSLALELVLYLSWHPQPGVDLTPVADELKAALRAIPMRPCSLSALTSCLIMIGAIAADKGSVTRAWFVSELKSAVLTLQSRGCDNPLEILEKGFTSDSDLLTYFRALWKELDCYRGDLQTVNEPTYDHQPSCASVGPYLEYLSGSLRAANV
ncbi:hypothetical protein BJ170DRAFT_644657 [Xylariales sp. AK1849]|nr:hypothetical protein BJ170DRAFT_644657 [Xylariales sp. AK1849]